MLGGRSRPGSLVPTPLGSKMKHDRRQGEEPNWFQPALARGSTGPRRDLYQGNEWDRPLHEDEWRILYYLLREMSFVVDFAVDSGRRCLDKRAQAGEDNAGSISYRAREKPRSQCLRPLASIYVAARWIIFLIVLYYAAPALLHQIGLVV